MPSHFQHRMGGSRRLVFAPMLRVYTLWKGITYQEDLARETHSGQTPQWREAGAMTVALLTVPGSQAERAPIGTLLYDHPKGRKRPRSLAWQRTYAVCATILPGLRAAVEGKADRVLRKMPNRPDAATASDKTNRAQRETQVTPARRIEPINRTAQRGVTPGLYFH